MKIGGGLWTLDQIVGGTLINGIVPAGVVRLYDAAAFRSLVEEDFLGGTLVAGGIGQNGWQASAVGTGTPVAASGALNHPGQIILSTGGTINSFETLYLALSAGVQVHSGNLFDLTFIFQASIGDGTIGYNIGLQSNLNTQDPADGIYLQKKPADANIFVVCRAGGVETRINSFFGANANWHTIRIIQDPAGTVDFLYDNVDLGTINANVPAVVLNPLAVITNAAAADKRLTLDYYGHQITVAR